LADSSVLLRELCHELENKKTWIGVMSHQFAISKSRSCCSLFELFEEFAVFVDTCNFLDIHHAFGKIEDL
jgi:hypothetical protein